MLVSNIEREGELKMGIMPTAKNSLNYHKRSIVEFIKGIIDETIFEKLETKSVSSSSSNAFCIADMGCSAGPNTFYYVQNIIEAIEHKFISQGFTCEQMPQFQVFFNDLPFNDFNTLFKSLPPRRRYFSAGVPGSFHGRLFPDSSLHFVHSSYTLHWLSEVPEEVLDKESSAWNKGRVHYTGASEVVVKAFAAQFGKDMGMFLDARTKELVEGSMMVLIMPSIPDGISPSNVPIGILLNHLGSCLNDMAKEGLVCEDLVDSFNIPMYCATPKELTHLIEENGCFSIERMVPTDCECDPERQHSIMMHFRAGLEAVITRHFGVEIINELFERFLEKMDEVKQLILSSNAQGSQLTVILKRIYYN